MSRVDCRIEIRIEWGSSCDVAAPASPLPILPPPPELAGDVALQIARLVAESAHLQKTNAHRSQTCEESAARAAEDRAIAKMHEKARSMGSHALWSGVATAAGGAMSVTGAAWSATSPCPNAAKATAKGLEAGGKATSEMGGVVSGLDRAAQAHADARIEVHQTTAKRAQRSADAAAEDVRAARELLERIIGYVREASQTRSATLLACVR